MRFKIKKRSATKCQQLKNGTLINSFENLLRCIIGTLSQTVDTIKHVCVTQFDYIVIGFRSRKYLPWEIVKLSRELSSSSLDRP